jgi:hypothetical protein
VAEHLWHFINNLLESSKYAENYHKLHEQSVQVLQKYDSRKKKIEDFKERVRKLSDELEVEIDSEQLRIVLQRITDFTSKSIKDVSEVFESELEKEISELNEKANAEKIKATRLLERFFMGYPVRVLEKTFKLSYTGGAYSCYVTYRCVLGIEYCFNILCHESDIFSQELKVSKLSGEMRIPVAVSSSWIKKSSVKFEKVSDYIVSGAEFSDNHSYVEVSNTDKGTRVILSSPFPEDRKLIGVEFIEGGNKIDITSHQDILSHLDRDAIVSFLSGLRKEVISLEEKKGPLKEVNIEGTDILKNLEIGKLVERILEYEGREFKELIKKLKDKELSTKNGILRYPEIAEKIKMIHSESDLLSFLLA